MSSTLTPMEPRIRLLDGDRNVEILDKITFIDTKGKQWICPIGFVSDGSSKPRIVWSFSLGSPFVGADRVIAFVHDFYCGIGKERPMAIDFAKRHGIAKQSHKDVHRMFYEGCLVCGMKPSKARRMYRYLKIGGPKWK